MNTEQKRIHARALEARTKFHNFELDFIAILQDAERTRLPRALNKRSLHVYAVDVLGFTPPVAYMFIAVARKAICIPELIKSNLSVFVLSRLMSTITPQNAAELIHLAQTKSSRELDVELGRRNPKHKAERTKIHSEECVELTLTVSKTFLEKLKRVQGLLAQKNAGAGIGFALEAGLEDYLRRHDPVQKAERSMKRKDNKATVREPAVDEPLVHETLVSAGTISAPTGSESIASANSVGEPAKFCAHRKFRRTPLTAAQRHAVFARDQGRCTSVDSGGVRCNSEQWIQVHHIIEVAHGGSNDPANLTNLCSFHHDLVHQLEFPFDHEVAG